MVFENGVNLGPNCMNKKNREILFILKLKKRIYLNFEPHCMYKILLNVISTTLKMGAFTFVEIKLTRIKTRFTPHDFAVSPYQQNPMSLKWRWSVKCRRASRNSGSISRRIDPFFSHTRGAFSCGKKSALNQRTNATL